jgi:hypothetical protein
MGLIAKQYPAQILSLISKFKRTIIKTQELLGMNRKLTVLNFNNPILKSPLLLSRTYSIYPDNKDVYIEFNSENLNAIHNDLEKMKIVKTNKDGVDTCGLELESDGNKVISIFSDEDMIKFIEFLLSNIIGHPISKILQSVQVPKIEDLKSIISSFNSMSTVLVKVNQSVTADFDSHVNNTIYQN